MSTSSRARKNKNLGFFLRIFSLLIVISAIIISVVFSTKYVENNSKLSIEFAGGYQTQVQYDGKSSQREVINLLKNRVDPLGTSNVNIESVTSGSNNKYNLALSKDAGVDISTFVHSVLRRGYSYIIDKDGNDLLATEKKDDNASTWTKRDKRLLTSNIFSNIKAINNTVSHRPELVFDVKDDSVLKSLTSSKDNTFYIYSDIGQLLDYIRNSMDGIRSLAFIIDSLKNDDEGNKTKASLTSLLDNNTPGLGNKGSDILARAKSQDPILARLLNSNENGQFGINWIYSDNLNNLNSPYKLSVDTNDEKNTYDPSNRFDPTASPIVGSPMNAWLPYIKDLLRLPYVSDILHADVIDYRYIPYWVGEVSVTGNSIVINSDTFNLETVEQMKSVLTSGLAKNNFTMLSYANVSPTLGATTLKVAIIVIVLVTVLLAVVILFYYRILGIIILIIISLFLVFTIVSFVFINGIVGPESVIALIIGFALLLDLIINLLERFKSENLQGKSLISAFKSANKKTLSSSLDCSAIILIVNLTIFWFGTRAIKGFIIMTSITTFGVIIFGIILLRLMLWAVLHNNWLENKPQLLGININRKSTVVLNATTKNKKIKKSIINFKSIFAKFKITNWNCFHKLTKWILSSTAVIILASGITYGVTGANFGSGFDQRFDFIGMGTVLEDPSNPEYDTIKFAESAKIFLNNEIQNSKQFSSYFKDINFALITASIGGNYQFKIIIATTINSQKMQGNFNDFLRDITKNWKQESTLQWGEINSVVAKSGIDLLINMIIAIALSFVVILIYIIIRFQLTYVIPLIIAIIFSLVMTLAIISICQVIISTSIVGILLGVMILTIISIMAIFDNIREMKINNNQTQVIMPEEIIEISNKSIQKALPRTLAINGVVLITSMIVIFIIPSFWVVSLSLLIGCIVSLISSYFIAPFIWVYFEKWRVSRYKKRINKIKKHFLGADEYIIKGINE